MSSEERSTRSELDADNGNGGIGTDIRNSVEGEMVGLVNFRVGQELGRGVKCGWDVSHLSK